MSLHTRRLAQSLGVLVLAVLLASCTERATEPSASGLKPGGPSLGYIPPALCQSLTDCGTTIPLTDPVHTEQLQVCKIYPDGTGPAITAVIHVGTGNAPLGPQDFSVQVQPNTCTIVWRNGESNGNLTDTMYVTEVVPAGYVATSQMITIVRNGPRDPINQTFTTTTYPSTSVTSGITGIVGGPQIPGMRVEFTNRVTSVSCTFTQGYWKNHEANWPAPYSPTAQWLDGSHVVTGMTWDGLMDVSVAGGNSYLQLADQWIAAKLNLGSGSSTGIPAVDAALTSGGAWLLANTPAVTSTVPVIKNAQATAWASTLNDFNNGLLGISHCN